jgi:hypothetical protein
LKRKAKIGRHFRAINRPDLPADKPAPLIVTLRKPLVFKPQAASRPSFGEGADRIMFTDDFLTKHRTISPKTMEEAEDESVHIVEISNTRPPVCQPLGIPEFFELTSKYRVILEIRNAQTNNFIAQNRG